MKLTKTQQLTAILSVLCLLAAANSAFAATVSTYVGVKAGDIFEYTLTVTGASASNPWPGTYDWTLTIDNVTDKGDYATIDVTMVIKNAT